MTGAGVTETTAIELRNVGKAFLLYNRSEDRLKQFILPRLHRAVGRAPRAYYHEYWAVRDVSLTIRKGDVFGIVGRNGSGKSTLLQMIAGTLAPSRGSITVNGRLAAILELGSGFSPDYTGRENVRFYAGILGLSDAEIEARMAAIEAFADIGEYFEQPLKSYSSGMVVRLAFAVVAHVDADILIIDEALAVGDAFFVQKCMRFLRDFMQKGTVVFVSHDIGAVVNLCNRAMLLHRGEMKLIASPREVSEVYLEALHDPESLSDREAKVVEDAVAEPAPPPPPLDEKGRVDHRQLLLINSEHRNDIEIVSLNPEAAAFGEGGARIVDVRLMTPEGHNLSWVVGGEIVELVITAEAGRALAGPIIGFYLIDRLGQWLFGDNTYITHARDFLTVEAGARFEARFRFVMPILPAGDYTISPAVAEGTQNANVMHHWVHHALHIKSHASSNIHGLMGVPMLGIKIDTAVGKK